MVLAQDACEGNFDCDGDVDGTDAAVFKSDFGRSGFNNPCPPDAPAPVQKTGQITVYGPRDDGYWQQALGVEWPNPRFTDNGDGTVTDNLTGLIWLKDANCFGQKTWDQLYLIAMDCLQVPVVLRMLPVLEIGGFPIDLNWKVYWIWETTILHSHLVIHLPPLSPSTIGRLVLTPQYRLRLVREYELWQCELRL